MKKHKVNAQEIVYKKINAVTGRCLQKKKATNNINGFFKGSISGTLSNTQE